MKLTMVLLLALMAAVVAIDVAEWVQEMDTETKDLMQDDEEPEWDLDDDEDIKADTFGLILNAKARKVIKNTIKQLPCGWPDSNIPPLAPYTKRDLELHINQAFLNAAMKFKRFRFDGLDDMQIFKLKMSYALKKRIKFHFNFKQLKVTAKDLSMDSLADLMKPFGIKLRYEGNGPLQFSLENLSLEGHFKYTMPILIGSIQISKFVCVVRLGGVQSNIGGLLGNGNTNGLINSAIEETIPMIIDSYQKEISSQIEAIFVPRMNKMLRGKKMWDALNSSSKTTSTCKPDPAPWSLKEPENTN